VGPLSRGQLRDPLNLHTSPAGGCESACFPSGFGRPGRRRVVTPNATTLYGTGFIDLTDEPFVIEPCLSAPAT